MAISLDVNLACTRIHDVIQSSGLHYIINQTPWSSYITIRRKFVNKCAISSKVVGDEESEMITQLRRENEKLKVNLENAEMEAANAEKTVESLSSKMKLLENAIRDAESKLRVKDTEILDHEEELKKKDIIIHNMNTGFNNKIVDLKSELVELKSFKREMIKKEKKAQKKQRQKAEREVKGKSDVELVKNEKSEGKDDNENYVEVPCPTLLSPPCLSIARNPPCSPASPHTPASIPPAIYQCNSGAETLSGYFTDPSDITGNPRTFLSTEYIKSLSKINLAPRRPES